MNRVGFLIVTALFASACRHEQSAGPARNADMLQAPIASLRHDAQIPELTGGKCRSLSLDELERSGWRAAVLLIRHNGRDQRRILVVLDSTGELRRYSDVRFSSDGWAIDVRNDSTANVGMVSLWGERRSARGSAAEVLDAPSLGYPRSIATLVQRTCAAELNG